MKPYIYINKETYVNRIDDINGTRSKVLILNKGREVYFK